MPENAAGRKFRVLFVCTGNICRSPFAQVLTRYLLDVHLGAAAREFEVTSAGVGAVVGAPMHPASRRALEPWGLAGAAAQDFRARQLTAVDLATADLVLTATTAHRADALRIRPKSLPNVFTVREFAGLVGSVDLSGLPVDPVARALALVPAARGARGMTPALSAQDYSVPDPIRGSVADHLNSARLAAEALQATVAALVPAGGSALASGVGYATG
jgi:protein-tyrosine phosphatase